MRIGTSAPDPRTMIDDDVLADANRQARPPIAAASGITPGLMLGGAAVLLLGVMTFTGLASGRGAVNTQTPLAATRPAPDTDDDPDARARPEPSPYSVVPAPPPSVAARPVPAPVLPAANGLNVAAIVVDLTKGGLAPVAAVPGAAAAAGSDGQSAEEKFAERVAREEIKPARAVRITNTVSIVPQGTVIAGVLETAINSDLPGYVRAIVSRDVSGFDGSKVLVPAGSRLIGQYRSGLATGQSRAFIVWTRLIRPDGVSISLGSPATDTLGRAGLGGKVDSHFLKRFGSAILLSVVQGGVGAAFRGNNDFTVTTADDAKNIANTALERDIAIPPTVKVAQGTPIRIFTARDLDFTETDAP